MFVTQFECTYGVYNYQSRAMQFLVYIWCAVTHTWPNFWTEEVYGQNNILWWFVVIRLLIMNGDLLYSWPQNEVQVQCEWMQTQLKFCPEWSVHRNTPIYRPIYTWPSIKYTTLLLPFLRVLYFSPQTLSSQLENPSLSEQRYYVYW